MLFLVTAFSPVVGQEGISLAEHLLRLGYLKKAIPHSDGDIFYRDAPYSRGVQQGDRVKIRYWDGWLKKELDGANKAEVEGQPAREWREAVFTIGGNEVGNGVQLALVGLRAGQKREVWIREENYGKGLKLSRPFIEVELLETE